MPAPFPATMKQLAKTNFCGFGIKLPVDWNAPGNQFDDAFVEKDRNVQPNSPGTLFQQATLNRFHVDTARDIAEKFERFIDTVCDAVCSAIDTWLNSATIGNVLINGPTGTLAAGGVLGPALAPLVLEKAPQLTPQELKYSAAISNALGSAWYNWSSGLCGSLMYPSFAMFPGAVAPPTPNVPAALVTMSSPGEGHLAASALKDAMLANLGDTNALHAEPLFNAISQAFDTVFVTLKSTTTLQNVLGTGPVPCYAPPYVPAGPVSGGTGAGAPGCFV